MIHHYILWDFDGTLGRRTSGWSGALLEVLHSHGIGAAVTANDLRPFLATGYRWHNHHLKNHARTSPELWWRELEPFFERAFREGAGIPEPESLRLAKQVRTAYVNPSQFSLFPDVHQTLTALSAKGWRHVLLTNHVPELGTILQVVGIQHHFAAIFNSADTGVEKPHPEAFENVRLSLPSGSKMWMIGDNFTADIQGAESAGIPAILVRKPHPSARRYADDLAGVVAMLDLEAK
jgi:putative hydrolase of the HAD superfamily